VLVLADNKKVTAMKNRIQLGETTTVCCVCGSHISGPWPARTKDLSHGYCKPHYQAALRDVQAYLALLDGRQTLTPHTLAA
jgi:hypothetical protein